MTVKVGINGFGRIGRNALRTALADKSLDFVAVNDLTDPKTLAHLLKYDSILGNLPHTIIAGTDNISIDGKISKSSRKKIPLPCPGTPWVLKWLSSPRESSPTPTKRRSICVAP